MLGEAGVPVENINRGSFCIHHYPPVAGQWADRSVDIPGWRVLGPDETPMPGDVVAEWIYYPDASGHVGIVVENEKKKTGVETMSVATPERRGDPEVVRRTPFGISGPQRGRPVFRRYVGPSVGQPT